MSPRLRRYLYPLLLLWAVGILGAFVVLAGRGDEQPPAATPDRIEAAESKIAEQQTASDAKIGAGKTTAKVGQPAPPLRLPTDRDPVTLRRGTPYVIEFVASWCPHCRAMAPVYQKAARAHRGVTWIIVSAAKEDRATMRNWHRTLLGEPMLGTLAFDDDLTTARRYGVTGYPTTVYVDARGTVADVTRGEVDAAEVTRLFDGLQQTDG